MFGKHAHTCVFLCRFYGDEICRGDAADVWSVLHPQVFRRGHSVLVRVLRVRQDHAQGEAAAPVVVETTSSRWDLETDVLELFVIACDGFSHLEWICTGWILPGGDQKSNIQVFDTKIRWDV